MHDIQSPTTPLCLNESERGLNLQGKIKQKNQWSRKAEKAHLQPKLVIESRTGFYGSQEPHMELEPSYPAIQILLNSIEFPIPTDPLVSAYADDTQIFYADKDPAKVQDTINTDLYHVDKWYTDNGMKRNHSKYQAIVMGKTQNKPLFRCENAVIPIAEDFDLLGVTVDDKRKFDRHVTKVCRKVSQQVAVL
ncbi:hypothetical protein ACROYT_G001579 [Oculina patagonica]